ncbi:MAG: O-antigen ligase family protein [Candidatus Omnitrophota bacterium]|jgi:hypothetical protein
MTVKIPYLNTRIETDLLLTLFLLPVWWVTGLSIVVYHVTALLIGIKLLVLSSRCNRPVRVPREMFCFVFLLLTYLISIAINVPLRPAQRVIASINNYVMLVMGFLIVLGVYNSDPETLFRGFFRACRWLCLVSVVVGAAALAYWFYYRAHFETEAWLARRMPSLLNYPYFFISLKISGTTSDWFSNQEFPRLTLYNQAPTATGGLLVMMMPMMMAYYADLKKPKRIEGTVLLILSFAVVFFTLSRAALYAFVGAWILVNVLEKDKKRLFLFGGLLLFAGLAGLIDKGVEFILEFRKPSTVGRFELYEEAFRIVIAENPILGVGVRFRDGFTMMAIGSHALYIELLFVSGFIGLILFLVFQGAVMMSWYSQKQYLKDPFESIVWKYLGMSLLGANIWLLSDTLFGLPFISYLYFLIVGGVLKFGAHLRRR